MIVICYYIGFVVVECKIAASLSWWSTATTIYTFMVISVIRWLMLNHIEFYKKYVSTIYESKPSTYILLPIWFLALIQVIPFWISWTDDINTDFACNNYYESNAWNYWVSLALFT